MLNQNIEMIKLFSGFFNWITGKLDTFSPKFDSLNALNSKTIAIFVN